MWLVAFFFAAAWAQTSTVTQTSGAVYWGVGASGWTSIPAALTTTINIQTGVQVYLNTTLTAFTVPPVLNLGADAVANTALVIQGVPLTVGLMNWYNGHVQMSGTAGAMIVVGVDFAAGTTIDRQIVGGKFSILVGVGVATLKGQLSCAGCTLDSNGRPWTLTAGAFVFANASSLSSSVTYSGTGSVSVSSGSSLAIGASTSMSLDAGVSGQVDGSIDLTADGSVDVNGAVVVGASGSISGNAQSKFNVKAGGNLTLTGGAGVRGGVINVDGSLIVNSNGGTTAVVVSGQGTTTIAGGGSVSVGGRFDANTALSVSTPNLQVAAKGDFRIGGGIVATFKNISFDTDSDWYLSFPSSGSFSTVACSGNVNLGGRFHLQLPDQVPSGTIHLVTAASITGTFNGAAMITTSASAGRRLLSSGQVSVTQNSIDYTSGAASYGFVGLVAAFVLGIF
jgi:hypothetical protein